MPFHVLINGLEMKHLSLMPISARRKFETHINIVAIP
jgi:hypothetical protein